MLDYSTNVAGVKLEHPLMNAAGTCRLLAGDLSIRELVRTPTAAVMIGSITVTPREGNPGNVYWADNFYSLNSMGLPNPGLPYYEKNFHEMVALTHGVGKPLFVSVAGFTPHEYALLALKSVKGGVDLVELNLSCPNTWEGGNQNRIACFYPELVFAILGRVKREIGADAKVSVKLAPFSDPGILSEVAQVLKDTPLVKAVTAVNTFPNAFAVDPSGTSWITFADGFAGLAGTALKPIGLGQVKQLRSWLPNNVDIIGVGGISRGRDIVDYLSCGAKAVQIATALLERGPNVFSTMLSEYIDIVG